MPKRRCPEGTPKGRGLDGPGDLAEGCYREAKDRLHFFRVAAGSAAEACAVLDLADVDGAAYLQARLRRVVVMRCKLGQQGPPTQRGSFSCWVPPEGGRGGDPVGTRAAAAGRAACRPQGPRRCRR